MDETCLKILKNLNSNPYFAGNNVYKLRALTKDFKADEAIEYLINEGFVVTTAPIHDTEPIEYEITQQGRNYLSLKKKEVFFKWVPIVISCISLIVSILVAIYK